MKKILTLRRWIFYVPIYGVDLCLLHGPAAAANEYIAERFGIRDAISPRHAGHAMTIVNTKTQGVEYLIWTTNRTKRSADLVYDLCHETHHTAFDILRNASVVVTDDHEASAYLQEYLFRECWRRMGRTD